MAPLCAGIAVGNVTGKRKNVNESLALARLKSPDSNLAAIAVAAINI